MNEELKDRTIKLIEKKEVEINTLIVEGHIPTQEAKKVLNKCKKLRREIEDPNFECGKMMSKYSEMYMSHRFLYHPDHRKDLLGLIEDFK